MPATRLGLRWKMRRRKTMKVKTRVATTGRNGRCAQ